jgi:hypothetical protein
VFVTPELRVSDPERERALLESTADVFTALGQGFRRLPDGNVVLPVKASQGSWMVAASIPSAAGSPIRRNTAVSATVYSGRWPAR